MGLIRTLVDYGHQAYEGLKPPAKPEAPAAAPQEEDINYPQIKLSGQAQADRKPKLAIKDFKQTLGQDTAFIQTTLRQKLAEYGASPNSRIQLYREDNGVLKIRGAVTADTAARIEQDINRNTEFKQRYLRLSANQPTLDYIQNNLKIHNTYGSSNSIFESLISGDPQNNSLQDLTTRFGKLHRASTQLEEAPPQSFSISV